MATYLILNSLFIVVVCLVLRVGKRHLTRPVLITLLILTILTAIFDNLIIASSIVAYDPTKLLGIYVFMAPIEDFMYPLLAVVLVPTVWHMLGERDAQ